LGLVAIEAPAPRGLGNDPIEAVIQEVPRLRPPVAFVDRGL
jgi:hypothetical protein